VERSQLVRCALAGARQLPHAAAHAVLPSDRNRGDKRNQNIIDSTGRFSARTLSLGDARRAHLAGAPWMKLTTPDPDLAEFGPVKEWLHVVTLRMLTIFATVEPLQRAADRLSRHGHLRHRGDVDAERHKDLFRAYSYPIGSYAVGLDHRGLVTTFVRDYELTVRQIVEEFGVQPDGSRTIDWTRISATVKNLWDQGNYETPWRSRGS
jgi:hypothetical protein